MFRLLMHSHPLLGSLKELALMRSLMVYNIIFSHLHHTMSCSTSSSIMFQRSLNNTDCHYNINCNTNAHLRLPPQLPSVTLSHIRHMWHLQMPSLPSLEQTPRAAQGKKDKSRMRSVSTVSSAFVWYEWLPVVTLGGALVRVARVVSRPLRIEAGTLLEGMMEHILECKECMTECMMVPMAARTLADTHPPMARHLQTKIEPQLTLAQLVAPSRRQGIFQ